MRRFCSGSLASMADDDGDGHEVKDSITAQLGRTLHGSTSARLARLRVDAGVESGESGGSALVDPLAVADCATLTLEAA